MNVAHAAWDLQSLSGGRFELGLGSQVRGNIVGRYSTSWSPPVPRMREYVGALRAIFACWQSGEKLSFEGEHYRFTRMQPFFNPGPLDEGPPMIHLAAIGPAMTALAGEAVDGLMCHPTNSSPRYLRERMWPRLETGAQRTGRDLGNLVVMAADMVATGPDLQSVQAAREGIRELFGFLFSTRAYWPSLDLYGFSGLGEELLSLTRQGAWGEMTERIPDELLDQLVPSGVYSEISDGLRERFDGLAQRLTFPLPDDPALEPVVAEVIRALKS
ncbi:MAG: TIGR03617 family F420-dependent LLM class oxidoreductase, partial [Myxococcota bacterium]